MTSDLYDRNIDDIDIKDYTKQPDSKQIIINELVTLDPSINKIKLQNPTYTGSFSKVYVYRSDINKKDYVLRNERINAPYYLKEAQTEFAIQQKLAKDDIAPKIYYAALYNPIFDYGFITIMDKYDNLNDYLKLVKSESIDESKKFNIFVEIFQQCLNLVYKMIFEHEFYCADQKIQNFVYKEYKSTNTYDIKMIDFDNKFCNDERIINNVIFKKDLSLLEIEKNKYYYMKSLWLQIILFFDRTNKNYLSKNYLIEKIITKTLTSNDNITKKYNEETYDKFMCNDDFINWLIDKNDYNQMWVYNYYTNHTKDEIKHKEILNCLATPPPVYSTPTPLLSTTSSTSTIPSLTYSSKSPLSQISSYTSQSQLTPSSLSKYGGKNQNRKSNKNQNNKLNKNQNKKSNKNQNKKQNKKSNKKLNKKSNRKLNRKSNKKQNKKSNKKSNKNKRTN